MNIVKFSGTWNRMTSAENRFHRMLSSREKPEGSSLPVTRIKSLSKRVQQSIREQRECPRSTLNVAFDYPDFVGQMHRPGSYLTCEPADFDKINIHNKNRKE